MSEETESEKAMRQVKKDAKMLGAGWAMHLPDGTVRHIDPRRIVLKPESKEEPVEAP